MFIWHKGINFSYHFYPAHQFKQNAINVRKRKQDSIKVKNKEINHKQALHSITCNASSAKGVKTHVHLGFLFHPNLCIADAK